MPSVTVGCLFWGADRGFANVAWVVLDFGLDPLVLSERREGWEAAVRAPGPPGQEISSVIFRFDSLDFSAIWRLHRLGNFGSLLFGRKLWERSLGDFSKF